MNPRLFSNLPLNQMKGLYKDIGRTVTEDVPWTYALRNSQARKVYDNLPEAQRKDFKWGEGTFSGRRALALGATAYVGADTAYRALSGGSMYRNSSGQRDIVGIPLI